MHRASQLISLFLVTLLAGCQWRTEDTSFSAIFNNGSTTGRHIVSDMTITTASGGQHNFAMGAVSGYPGASSSGGKIDTPIYIEGYWAKGWEELASYHHISAPIPTDAADKIKIMNGYYESFKRSGGVMQVIVDGPRVRVFYTLKCSPKYNNCTKKNGGDPDGFVNLAPNNVYGAVLLFDGIGETSTTPYPGTHFEQVMKREQKALPKSDQ